MGFLIGIFKRILKLICAFSILVAIVVFIPNLPPYTKFTSIEIKPTQQWVSPLVYNTALNNPERLYEDKLIGPETFHIWNRELYTSLATGEIVKLSPAGHVTFVTKIGQPCSGLMQEHICGRPLGFIIDGPNKLIYIADAYYGIWKVNLDTDRKQLLVSPRVPIEGRIPKLFNSVALDKNGNLFWTDSSSDFHLRDGLFSVLADPSGRLLHYDTAKNESKVLLDNIWFANGLVVSPDNQFVVIAETSKLRLIKYYTNGAKKGAKEVFVDLPGLPDNVRPLPDGSGLLVSLYNAFDDDYPMIAKSLAAAPLARKLVARSLRLFEIPFEFLNSLVPHHILEDIIYKIGSFGSIVKFSSGMTGLVQIDWNGKVIASYFNSDGKLNILSDVIVFNNKLYTGAPTNNFISAVPVPPLLEKAFSLKPFEDKKEPKANVSPQNKIKVEEKKESPKVSKTDNTPKAPQNEKIKPKIEKQPENVQTQTSTKQSAKPEQQKEVKTKEIPKAADVKPLVEKEPQRSREPVPQAKVVTKEPEIKNKVTPKVQEKPNPAPKLQVPKHSETKATIQEKPQNEREAKPIAKEPPKPSGVNIKSQKNLKDELKEDAKSTAKYIDKVPKANPKETENKPKLSKDAEKPQMLNNANSKDNAKKDKKTTTEKPEKPIPVEEIIPSDTAKPNKEKLKVIKKSGPQEIPNPHI